MLKTRTGTQLLLVAAIVMTIGCDRVTKHLAVETLAGSPDLTFLAGTVRLAYAENSGGFLSLGADLPPTMRTALFTVGTGIMLIVLISTAIRFHWHGRLALGLTLFAAGALSNWVDRLIHGSVVDFMNVGVGPLRTGIFNVADVAIMTGIVLLVFTRSMQRTAR